LPHEPAGVSLEIIAVRDFTAHPSVIEPQQRTPNPAGQVTGSTTEFDEGIDLDKVIINSKCYGAEAPQIKRYYSTLALFIA
jgi:hypothetical protein